MQTRKYALRQAQRYRTCPSPSIFRDPSQRDQVEAHRRICPFCSTPERFGDAPWETLAHALAAFFSDPAKVSASDFIAPGQLRFIKAQYGGWRDHNYYHPPLVLIVEASPDASPIVRVAQTYFNAALAAPGDLILRNADAPWDELFIQCHNCYPVLGNHLDRPVGRIPEPMLEQVAALASNPAAYSEDAIRPRPLEPNDLRYLFRAMERACADFFAWDDSYALDRLKSAYTETANLQNAMRRSAPGLFWPTSPRTIEATLTWASFPDDQLPWAAQDTTSAHQAVAPLIEIKDYAVHTVRPIAATILVNQEIQAQWVASGQIIDLPNQAGASRLLLYLADQAASESAPRSPSHLIWEPSSGYFHAAFDIINLQSPRLTLALLIFR